MNADGNYRPTKDQNTVLSDNLKSNETWAMSNHLLS